MKRAAPPRRTSRASPLVRWGVGAVHGIKVWAGWSDHGLCALRFADRHRPSGPPTADREARDLLRQIEEWLDGRRRALDIPLDLQGTPFQQRVWRMMQKIPRGQTWSYTELARRIGQPRAVRAVANACACNPIIILVPCHRIIAKDGGLGGYGGGLQNKRELLDWERA